MNRRKEIERESEECGKASVMNINFEATHKIKHNKVQLFFIYILCVFFFLLLKIRNRTQIALTYFVSGNGLKAHLYNFFHLFYCILTSHNDHLSLINTNRLKKEKFSPTIFTVDFTLNFLFLNFSFQFDFLQSKSIANSLKAINIYSNSFHENHVESKAKATGEKR